MKKILVSISDEDYVYLKAKGIKRSSFVRQSIQKLKKKEIQYDYMEK